MHEPEQRDGGSHRQDSSTRVDPEAEIEVDWELEPEQHRTRRRRHPAAPGDRAGRGDRADQGDRAGRGNSADHGDSRVNVVVPTGRPGRVAPRLTGRRPAHSLARDPVRLGRRGWLVAACAVVLLVASIAVVDISRHDRRDSETRLGNPSGIPTGPADGSPVVGGAPPDYDTPGPSSPDAGVPGDGSAPPTAQPDPSLVAAPAAPAGPGAYRAVAGEGCSQTADHGYFRKGFAADWRLRGSGGLTTDGCHGAVVAVPMSGDAHRDDNDNVVVWWFKTAPVATGSCEVSVYVPKTSDDTDSAGRPAHYLVFGTDNATGPTIGEFNVDQTRDRGNWVEAGKFSDHGRLSVRMVTRGVDFGPGRDGAHLGASGLRIACTAG